MPAVEAPPSPVAAPATQPPAAPAPKASPPVPDTPMSRMRQRMDAESVLADLSDPDPMKTVKQRKAAQSEPPKPSEPAKAQEPPKAEPESDPFEAGDEPKPDTKPKADAQAKPEDEPITDEELKSERPPAKGGPWKLKKYWEKRAAAVEMERNELKEKLGKVPNIERLEQIEKRNRELEEEIRFQNYSKSQEYQDKYQKPYEDAWAKAISDLGELEVMGEDGAAVRKAAPNDLLSLARMPLGEARKLANQMFGDNASDVMMHRQKIRDLADAQHKALEDAKKSGSERESQWAERSKALHTELTTLWQKFNDEDAAKHDFLRPAEGDEEWNTRLDKAKALVEGSYAANPADPNLTPEQRAKVIRDRVAVKNRAIAYSPLKLKIARLEKQLKERDDKLKAYEESEPTGGSAGGGANGKPQPAATPMERAKQRLRAEAVPAPQYF